MIALYYDMQDPDSRTLFTQATACGETAGNLITLLDGTNYFYMPVYLGYMNKKVSDTKDSLGEHKGSRTHLINLHDSILTIKIIFNPVANYRTNVSGTGVPVIDQIDLLFDTVLMHQLHTKQMTALSKTIKKLTYITSIRDEAFVNGSTNLNISLQEINEQCFGMLVKFQTQAKVNAYDLLSVENEVLSLSEVRVEKSGVILYEHKDECYKSNQMKKLQILGHDTGNTYSIYIPFSRHFWKCFSEVIDSVQNFSESSSFRLKMTSSGVTGNIFVQMIFFNHAWLSFNNDMSSVTYVY